MRLLAHHLSVARSFPGSIVLAPSSGSHSRRLFWTVLFLTSLGLGSTGRGGIGQTEAEVKSSYGNPVTVMPANGEPGQTKCYLSSGLSISVTYIFGRSVREIVAKTDKSRISEKELRHFLETNSGGAAWNFLQFGNKSDQSPALLEWTNEDNGRVAFYDLKTKAFFVATEHFINVTNVNRRNEEKAAARLAGRASTGKRLKDLSMGGNSSPTLNGVGAGFQNGQSSPQPAAASGASH